MFGLSAFLSDKQCSFVYQYCTILLLNLQLSIYFYTFLEFSVKEWSTEKSLDFTNLPKYAKKVLYRDLGISQYLEPNECSVKSFNDSQGWSSGLYFT